MRPWIVVDVDHSGVITRMDYRTKAEAMTTVKQLKAQSFTRHIELTNDARNVETYWDWMPAYGAVSNWQKTEHKA